MRKRDMHILSAGILMYTSDLRFQVIHPDKSENWTLQIKSPQQRDSGVYECQVSTEPKMSLNYSLNVVGECILNYSSTYLPNPFRLRPTAVAAAAACRGPPPYYRNPNSKCPPDLSLFLPGGRASLARAILNLPGSRRGRKEQVDSGPFDSPAQPLCLRRASPSSRREER